MKHLYNTWVIGALIIGFCLKWNSGKTQTVPVLSTGLVWGDWFQATTVTKIENQFNAGRRHEETNKGLPAGRLGTLQLPGDFLSLDFKEQAIILLNAERSARNGVKYGTTTYTVTPFEGVESTLCSIAQGHANDMQTNNFLSHTGSNGQNSSTRIKNAFPTCTEGTTENIAWNSYSNGFVGSIAVAIYNFIYDDACCIWGHRNNCLKMSMTTNNFDGTSRFGMVGFGRASGANGDFFVMDYFDPKPESSSCTYDIINFDASGGGDCPDNITLSGTIASGIYQASVSVSTSGLVPTNNNVDIIASNSVVINPVFEVQLGSELNIDISSCNGANARLSGPSANWEQETPIYVNGMPQFDRSFESEN